MFVLFLFLEFLGFDEKVNVFEPDMGRVKLEIKRLESTGNRQGTYSKRKCGILKKAKELSILCDIDILLLMFSPTGKPTMLHGEHRLTNIYQKHSQVLSLFDHFFLVLMHLDSEQLH